MTTAFEKVTAETWREFDDHIRVDSREIAGDFLMSQRGLGTARARLASAAPDMYRLLERVMGQAHQPFECIACESFSRKDDGTPDHEDGRIQPCAWLKIQKKVRGE